MSRRKKDQVTLVYILVLALFGVLLIALSIGLLYWLVPS
jgi:hypothetical protein